MKIIYAFKFLETNIKRLIQASFSPKSKRDFYRWDFFINFLSERNIDSKKLLGYQKVLQLNIVNNAINHNDDFENKLKSIP